MTPKLCPICGTDLIQKITRDTLLSDYFTSLVSYPEAAVAYHCVTGHVFLIVAEDFRNKEPLPEGKGYSMCV
jgi:hypothetical protein